VTIRSNTDGRAVFPIEIHFPRDSATLICLNRYVHITRNIVLKNPCQNTCHCCPKAFCTILVKTIQVLTNSLSLSLSLSLSHSLSISNSLIFIDPETCRNHWHTIAVVWYTSICSNNPLYDTFIVPIMKSLFAAGYLSVYSQTIRLSSPKGGYGGAGANVDN
jgi:hypothetical protein